MMRPSASYVMHGGSVLDEDYRVAIENGICKVNYYTYMNMAGGRLQKNTGKMNQNRCFMIPCPWQLQTEVKRM